MNVTLYSKPQCPQCDATVRALEKDGVAYSKIDITVDAEAYSLVESLGYRGVPVVVAGTEHWQGFRPDRIKALTS